MKRFHRLALISLVIVALLAVTLVGCARYYLTSQHASQLIADKLEGVLGVPVRIGEVDVGIKSGSSLGSLQVFEGEGQRPETPWLTVKDIQADLSALDVLGGESTPRRVVLSGAAVDLHFDADGHLLTKLPRVKPTGQPYPQLILEDAKLTLDQVGHPPLVVNGVHAEAGDQNGDLDFHGTVKDETWGEWTVEGTFKAAAGELSAHLKTPRVQVTQKKLEGLPFISPSAWRQVKLDGYTSVDLTLKVNLSEEGVHYRVELDPVDTSVYVTSIDLHADHASGKVIVEDRFVTVRNVKGRTAGGTIDLSKADLDFIKRGYEMKFNVRVDQVDLHQLPPSWKIPIPEAFKSQRVSLEGGVNDLTVTIKNGKAHTIGQGKGVIKTIFLGQPVRIDVTLEAQGDRFQFDTPKAKAAATFLKVLLIPPSLGTEVQEQPSGPHPLAAPVATGAQGLHTAAGGILGAGAGVMSQVNRWTKGLPKGKKTNYLQASTKLTNVDLEQLLKQLNVKLPFAVSGKVTVSIQLAMPIDTPTDYRAYKVQGSADLPTFNVAGVEMKDVTAKVRYEEGVLSLEQLHGQFPDSGGDFDGDGKLQLFPSGDLTLKLRVDRVPLNRALALLPGAEGTAEGALSGRFEAHVPANKVTTAKAWEAAGSLHSDRLAAAGFTLKKLSVALSLKDGVAQARDLAAELEGGPVSGNAELNWGNGYPFKGKLELKDADLAALERLPVAIKGHAGLVADFAGKLTPLTVSASGTASAKELSVADVAVDSLSFKWTADTSRIKLRDMAAKLYDGTISGSATLPLKDTFDGDADLKIQAVDAAKLVKAAASVIPFKIEGQVSGTVTATLKAAAPGKERELASKVELAAPKMRLQGVATQKVHGSFSYRAGGGEYRLEGEALGGKFEVEGKLPPVKEAAPKEPQGRLRIEGVRLSRLGEALGIPDALAPLAGRLDVDLPYNHEGPNRIPVGAGRFHLRDVRWAGTTLADDVQGDIRLTESDLQVRNLSGNLGGGGVRGTVVYNFKDVNRSWYNVQIERVEASLLLSPLFAVEAASPTSRPVGTNAVPVEGALEINLRGHLGHAWHGSGTIVLAHGKIYGADVSEWRLPVTMEYRPSQGTGQIDFADNNAQLANGRVQGRASLYWNSGLRLEGSLHFFDVDVPTLLRSTGSASKLAGGRATGWLTFAGDHVHSADDLTATLDALFAQAQPLQLPVLDVVARYVVPGQSTMTFQKGDVKATLSRGVVRLKRLSMTSPTVQIIVEGTLTLAGRVDLDVTANTGTLGLNPVALQLAGVPIPAVGPLPASTIVSASSLLAYRVLHLRVTGTVRNPSVQIDPVRLLTDEAVRFFVGAAVGVPLP